MRMIVIRRARRTSPEEGGGVSSGGDASQDVFAEGAWFTELTSVSQAVAVARGVAYGAFP